MKEMLFSTPSTFQIWTYRDDFLQQFNILINFNFSSLFCCCCYHFSYTTIIIYYYSKAYQNNNNNNSSKTI